MFTLRMTLLLVLVVLLSTTTIIAQNTDIDLSVDRHEIYAELEIEVEEFLTDSAGNATITIELYDEDDDLVVAHPDIIENLSSAGWSIVDEDWDITIGRNNSSLWAYMEPSEDYKAIVRAQDGNGTWWVDSISFETRHSQALQVEDIDWERSCNTLEIEMEIENGIYDNGEVLVWLYDQAGNELNYVAWGGIPSGGIATPTISGANLDPNTEYHLRIQTRASNGEVLHRHEWIHTRSIAAPDAGSAPVIVNGNNASFRFETMTSTCSDAKVSLHIINVFGEVVYYSDELYRQADTRTIENFMAENLPPGRYQANFNVTNIDGGLFVVKQQTFDIVLTSIEDLSDIGITIANIGTHTPILRSTIECTYELYATSGEKIGSGSITTGSALINMNDLPRGTYVLRIESEKGSYSVKLPNVN